MGTNLQSRLKLKGSYPFTSHQQTSESSRARPFKFIAQLFDRDRSFHLTLSHVMHAPLDFGANRTRPQFLQNRSSLLAPTRTIYMLAQIACRHSTLHWVLYAGGGGPSGQLKLLAHSSSLAVPWADSTQILLPR
ncbi:hypothetical protein BaRGS_00021691 [Batillaria attramentaria]|uniref:Uncharacterized protein n=1 Tax=Batillaria attramentaria TaxID=370345 RepID=A0ABD0KIW4_9CAEN